MNNLPRGVKKQGLVWLVSGAVIVLFLIGSDPLKLPLPVLLLPFLAFAVWIRSGSLALGLILRNQSRPSRKMRAIANSVAAVLLLVVTLQSLGQLSWRDLLLVAGLVVGLVFYFYKTDLV